MDFNLSVAPRVAEALAVGQPVVALESTIISHGLPWPQNLECALELEALLEAEDVVPATVAVLGGQPTVGLDRAALEHLAQGRAVAKASRRDLARVMAARQDGATTVAATMVLAARAGIPLFATGGIGGVHRGAAQSFDISADLTELARTPVAVVCAGAKSVLDLPRTLEVLETHGVPVVGYGTERFPAFYIRETELEIPRLDEPGEVARLIHHQRQLDLGGLVVTVPIPGEEALAAEVVEGWIQAALGEVAEAHIQGPAVTPYLLRRLDELSVGRVVRANLALVRNNVRVAAAIARSLATLEG